MIIDYIHNPFCVPRRDTKICSDIQINTNQVQSLAIFKGYDGTEDRTIPAGAYEINIHNKSEVLQASNIQVNIAGVIKEIEPGDNLDFEDLLTASTLTLSPEITITSNGAEYEVYAWYPGDSGLTSGPLV